MEEILHQEEVGKPGGGFNGVDYAGTDEPGCVEVNHRQQQNVDRPDAQRPARMKVVKVTRLVARREQNGGDQESGESEEQNHSRPSPQGRVINPSALQTRIAVIEDYPQNRQAAQAVEFRQVGGEPSWALDGHVSGVSELAGWPIGRLPQVSILRPGIAWRPLAWEGKKLT